MKERDLPIWDKETTICELERVWAIWVWVWANSERKSRSFQRKKRREPPLVVVVAVLAMSRGGRPWRLKELWEFWKREEGLRFRREGNRFEGFSFECMKIFWVWMPRKYMKEKRKRKGRQRKGKKIRINLLRIWVNLLGKNTKNTKKMKNT